MKLAASTLCLLSLCDLSQAQVTPGPDLARQLLHATVRIEVTKTNGQVYQGTGFYYAFQPRGDSTATVPTVVTCWHVISDSTSARMTVSLTSTKPMTREPGVYTANLPPKDWIRHPDTNVDLAIIPIAPTMQQLHQQGKRLDFVPINQKLIPSGAEAKEYSAFQEVEFVGYPIGIWDSVNNLPIARRGMTATDFAVDYIGRHEFLIDGAVYPGSSGSPVFIVDQGTFRNGDQVFVGDRVRFLGVLYAVQLFTSEGNVQIIPIPAAFDAKARISVPANLGLVIKADCLKDFDPILKHLAGSPPS